MIWGPYVGTWMNNVMIRSRSCSCLKIMLLMLQYTQQSNPRYTLLSITFVHKGWLYITLLYLFRENITLLPNLSFQLPENKLQTCKLSLPIYSSSSIPSSASHRTIFQFCHVIGRATGVYIYIYCMPSKNLI